MDAHLTAWPIRTRFRARTAVLGVIALAIAAAIPVAGPRVFPELFPTAAGDNPCYKHNAAEKSFHQKMNGARGGRGGLKLDPELSKVAKVHTKEMIAKNTLHHTSGTVLRRRITNWSTIGENVGVGGDVAGLHQAFMNSPVHRDNILYTGYNAAGVGAITKDGRLWVTVVFEGRSNPGTTLAMPRC